MKNEFGLNITKRLSDFVRKHQCQWLLYEIVIRQQYCESAPLSSKQTWRFSRAKDRANKQTDNVGVLEEVEQGGLHLTAVIEHRGLLYECNGPIEIIVLNNSSFLVPEDLEHQKKDFDVEFTIARTYSIKVVNAVEEDIPGAIAQSLEEDTAHLSDEHFDETDYEITGWSWS